MEIAYFERIDLNGLSSNPLILLESRLLRGRERSSLLVRALSHSCFLTSLFIHSVFLYSPFPFLFLYSLHSSLFFFLAIFLTCFSLISVRLSLFFLFFSLYTAKAFLYYLPWRVLLFYPLTTFGLVWVSFPDHPLIYQLLSHHHYLMLVAPRYIPKQKSFVLLFCFS